MLLLQRPQPASPTPLNHSRLALRPRPTARPRLIATPRQRPAAGAGAVAEDERGGGLQRGVPRTNGALRAPRHVKPELESQSVSLCGLFGRSDILSHYDTAQIPMK